MFDNIIFDFGNVLVRFDERIIMKKYFDKDADIDLCLPIIFDRKYWNKLDSGELTEDDVANMIKDYVPCNLYVFCESSLKNWILICLKYLICGIWFII